MNGDPHKHWEDLKQQLDVLAEMTENFVFLLDKQLHVHRVNRSIRTGYAAEAEGMDFFSFFGAQADTESRDDVLCAFGKTEMSEVFLRPVLETGEHRYYRVRMTAVPNGGTEPLLICLATDLTRSVWQDQEIRKWTEIFRHARWGIASSSREDGFFHTVNDEFARMHGYAVEEMQHRMQVQEVFAPDYRQTLGDEFARIHEKGQHAFESVHIRKDGSTFPVLVNASVVSDAEDRPVFRAVSVQDITEMKALEGELLKERALFKTMIYSLGDGVIATDLSGRVIVLNPVAEALTGWNADDALGQPSDNIFRIIAEDTREVMDNPVQKVLETGRTLVLGNHTLLVRKDGTETPVEDSAAPIRDESGVISGAVLVFRDDSEKKERLRKIEYLSFHDQLTGLYNRRFFDEEMERIDTKRNLPISILMIDVNGLKLTNDAFGHLRGDRLLICVAEVLRRNCRKDEIIARIGGDEFVVLLPDTDGREAELLSKRIYRDIANERIDSLIISVSVGIGTKFCEDEDIAEAYRKAEEQMYHKKITESRSMRSDTVRVIMNTLNEANERERIHAERVSEISGRIGAAMGLDSEALKELELAGLLHDIGKITVSHQVLNKPGSLSAEEVAEVRRHLETGYQILKSVDEYSGLAEYVLSHHERWDGRGYPRGIAGDAIPYISRIIAVADTFEAMTANRPYRQAMSLSDALGELEAASGSQLDPGVIEICRNDNWRVFREFL